MGNEQSDRGETAAFNIIKLIPGVGQAYGLVRMGVYGGKQDTDRVAASFTGSFVAPIAPAMADQLERVMIEDGGCLWKTPSDLLSCYRLGDLIEFDRGTHSHYGLYIGDGKVMHVYTGGEDKTLARIEEKTVEGVCSWLGTNSVRIRRMHDQIASNHFGVSPKSQDSMIADARRMEGKDVKYKFDERNCEYYATLWRYGYGFSIQVARPTSTNFGQLVPGAIVISAGLGVSEVVIYSQYKKISIEDRNKYY